MIRLRIGTWLGRWYFRCSRAGVSAWDLPNGDDAIFHEDQMPVAAVASGTWHSAGNDRTLIHLPQIDVLPYMVLMNPGDGNAMLDFHYYAEWEAEPRRLHLVNRQGPKTFAWAVLADVGGSANTFDPASAIDQITQLYRTLLGREPGTGMDYWVKKMQEGMTLEEVRRGFLASPEFRARAIDQITGLYRTLLRREPGTGMDYWVKKMQQGMTLEEVRQGFLESPEYRSLQT